MHAAVCTCGQPFVVVFTERVDFHGGEDTQVELAVSVSPEELRQLKAAGEALTSTLTRLVQGRRFLVKRTGVEPRWREDGFAIGPYG